jgi:EAL domain-containing protein (putative c-di-GMP-specific phosphodiesterase class I)/DNA-binding response OmpR family regulator
MADRRISILVIDDEDDLTTVVRGILEAQGYDVICANSGERGLELAYTERPNLVLLDIMMPGMDGFEVCRELQFGYTKDIPIIFLTAKTELAHMMEANRCGASAYVAKPFRAEHLVQTVRNVLLDASVYIDEITSLPTLAQTQVELQRTLQNHAQLGILYVALDGIAALEQAQGFEVVDEVFRAVGRRLSEARGRLLRSDDTISIASLGNAFLVALSPARERAGISEDDLYTIKRRLEEGLLAEVSDQISAQVLSTIGVYVGYARLSQSPKVRFRRALLQAVEEATARISQQRSEARTKLVHEFDRVLADEQISCVYQPVVALTDFAVLGYELLARGPEQSELHRPDALFEIARDQNRVPELDRMCRLMAARGSGTLPDGCLRFVNAEPVNLFFHAESDLFIDEFIAATPEHLRDKTVVEITEDSVIEDFDRVRAVIDRLRKHGFRIAVDDAGAGYSGLQAMVEIEPDFIKLDISLIRNLDGSLVKQRLIRTLRDFCREAGIVLIAEGIETQRQLTCLRRLEVPYGQGFLFAYPESPYPDVVTDLPVASPAGEPTLSA